MYLVRFEESQELGLNLRAELADLVQKERAAGGGADDAGRALVRAREGAAAETEELTLHDVARNGGAVERDERPAGA